MVKPDTNHRYIDSEITIELRHFEEEKPIGFHHVFKPRKTDF